MTNREAIEELNARYLTMSQCLDKEELNRANTAISMAIKALKQQPCEDAISRAYIEPIVEELENICINGDEHILSLLSNIKNAPSVTSRQKKGHWIERAQYSDGNHKIECSECGNHIFDRGHAHSFNVKNKYKYCPNCGCRMKSEVEE